MNFRNTTPFTRFNNDLTLTVAQNQILTAHSNTFANQNFVDSKIVGLTNDIDTRFCAGFLQYSFVYIITETVSEYPYPYFTEKTWKAMATGSPFIMINAQNSLLKLQEFGFKTFNKWWDEGYDAKPTAADRIESAIKLLKDLSHRSLHDLQSLKISMNNVITHNQQHLTTFQNLDLKNITNQI